MKAQGKTVYTFDARGHQLTLFELRSDAMAVANANTFDDDGWTYLVAERDGARDGGWYVIQVYDEHNLFVGTL